MKLEEIASKNDKYMEKLNKLKTGIEFYQKKLDSRPQKFRPQKQAIIVPEMGELERAPLASPDAGRTSFGFSSELYKNGSSEFMPNASAATSNLSASNINSLLNQHLGGGYQIEDRKTSNLTSQIDSLLSRVNQTSKFPIQAFQKHFQILQNTEEALSENSIESQGTTKLKYANNGKDNEKANGNYNGKEGRMKGVDRLVLPIQDRFRYDDFIPSDRVSSNPTTSQGQVITARTDLSSIPKPHRPPIAHSSAVDRHKAKLKESLEEKKKIIYEIPDQTDKESVEFQLSDDQVSQREQRQQIREKIIEVDEKMDLMKAKQLTEERKLLSLELESVLNQIQELESDYF